MESWHISEEAIEFHTKQISEFDEEGKDLLESISSLRSAVLLLSKHYSFLLLARSQLVGVAATAQNEIQKEAMRFLLSAIEPWAMKPMAPN